MEDVYASVLVSIALLRPDTAFWTIMGAELIQTVLDWGITVPGDPRNDNITTIMHQIRDTARIGQLDGIISDIGQANLIWGLTITVFLLLAFLLYNIASSTTKHTSSRTPNSNESQTEPTFSLSQAPSTTAPLHLSILFFYQYLFYPILLLANACFSCKSKQIEQSVTKLTEDLPVISTSSKLFSNNNEIVYELMWAYDTSQQCFGGMHILLGCCGVLLHVVNFGILFLHGRMSSFYPNPRQLNSKRNFVWVLHPVMFMVMSLLKIVMQMMRLDSSVKLYTIIYLPAVALTLLIELLAQPYFNKIISTINSFQRLSCIYLSLSINFWEDGEIPGWAIAAMLAGIVCIWVARQTVEARNFGHSSHQRTEKSDITLKANVYDVVYRFEQLKDKMCHGSEDAVNEAPTLRIVLEFLRMYYNHKQSCSMVDCFCHLPEENLFKYRLDKSLQAPYPKWLVPILNIVNHIIAREVEKHSSASTIALSSGSIDSIRLWAAYSVQNYGDTAKVLRTIYSMMNSEKSKSSSTFSSLDLGIMKKPLQIEISVLKEYVEANISLLNANPEVNSWRSAFVSTSNEAFSGQKLNTEFAIQSVNNLEVLCIDIEQALTSRITFVKELATQSLSLVKPAKGFLKACQGVEDTLSKLAYPSLKNSLKLSFLELFYLQFVKEDLYMARKKLRIAETRTLTSNLVSLLRLPGSSGPDSQLCTIGVSGENVTLHTIVHVTLNVKYLGHTPSSLVGKDLRLVLPNFIMPFHKSLLLPTTPRIHLGQRMQPYRLFIKESTDTVRPCNVLVRTNSSLVRGLEYIAFNWFSTENSEDLYVAIDAKCFVTDVNFMARAFFSISTSIGNYCSSLGTYIANYSTSSRADLLYLDESVTSPLEPIKQLQQPENNTSNPVSTNSYDAKSIFELKLAPKRLDSDPHHKAQEEEPDEDLPKSTFSCRLTPIYFRELDQLCFFLHLQPLDLSPPMEKRLQPQQTAVSNMPSPIISSSRVEREEEIRKMQSEKLTLDSICANLKYAQQTDEYKVKYSWTISKNTESPKPSRIDPFIPGMKKSIFPKKLPPWLGQSKTNQRAISSMLHKSHSHSHSSNSLQKLGANVVAHGFGIRASLNGDIQSTVQNLNNYFKSNLTSKSTITLSRHLHSLPTPTLTSLPLLLPYLLLLSTLLTLTFLDTSALDRFTNINTEIAIIDSNEFIHWVSKLHTFYFDVSRMYLDGKVTDDQFNKFGYNGTVQHLLFLSKLDGFKDMMVINMLRMDGKLYKSKYPHKHRLDTLHSVTIDIKSYDENTNSWVMISMKVLDALRFVQKRIDKMFASGQTADSLIGVHKDYSKSLDEQFVRYNCLNPISHFFYDLFEYDLAGFIEILQEVEMIVLLPIKIIPAGIGLLAIYYISLMYCKKREYLSFARFNFSFKVEEAEFELSILNRRITELKSFWLIKIEPPQDRGDHNSQRNYLESVGGSNTNSINSISMRAAYNKQWKRYSKRNYESSIRQLKVKEGIPYSLFIKILVCLLSICIS